jgi:parallel beta-helix repeat protein
MGAKNTFVFMLTALLAVCLPALGETRVSGVLERETRWRAEDGPFIVEGDIVVPRRATLIIMPGTRIIIRSGSKKTFSAEPFDGLDSDLISIRVQGSINSVGRRNNPIVFEPDTSRLAHFNWRGIILDEADPRHTEIAFTEISGATTGLTVRNSNALIRNNAIENCNIGIHTLRGGAPRIHNNLISSCFTAAIKVERSNPQIRNNIIAFNSNIGLWCDNSSRITFTHNCVFGNADGNFLDCEPEFGRTARAERNRDSTDRHGNIIADPIFIGSAAEARAIELDVNLPTDSARVRDTRLLRIPNLQFGTPRRKDPTILGSENRQLSTYSPCINMGDPGGAFRNTDGSRNTMGPLGGPD